MAFAKSFDEYINRYFKFLLKAGFCPGTEWIQATQPALGLKGTRLCLQLQQTHQGSHSGRVAPNSPRATAALPAAPSTREAEERRGDAVGADSVSTSGCWSTAHPWEQPLPGLQPPPVPLQSYAPLSAAVKKKSPFQT